MVPCLLMLCPKHGLSEEWALFYGCKAAKKNPQNNFTFNRVIVCLHSAVGCGSDCRARDHKFEFQIVHITFMELDIK